VAAYLLAAVFAECVTDNRKRIYVDVTWCDGIRQQWLVTSASRTLKWTLTMTIGVLGNFFYASSLSMSYRLFEGLKKKIRDSFRLFAGGQVEETQ
jgi:hypothetical protein